MSAFQLSAIARHTGGVVSGDASFTSVSTDTRNIAEGDLYLALQGERFDGNEFVDQAVASGAVAAVVREGVEAVVPSIQVADTRKALGDIASYNRDLFQGPVVGLTGSAGKTTCKEMISAILQQYCVYQSILK